MNNRFSTAIITSAVVGLLCACSPSSSQTETAAVKQETAFDRVVKTNTLRCGYATWYPGFYINPQTGNKAGFSYEIAEALGKRLGLKIEWAEEAGWGNAEQGLQTKRYDVMCAHVCNDARRTRSAYFSIPYVKEPIYTMIRSDDTRFDDNEPIANNPKYNNPDIKAVILKGTIVEFTANDVVPKAKQFDASEFNAESDLFSSVITKKADLTFNTALSIQEFSKKNPDRVKQVGEPVNFCHGSFMLPLGDDRLKNMVDSGLRELIDNGTIDQILSRHVGMQGKTWLSVAPIVPMSHNDTEYDDNYQTFYKD